MDRDLELWNAWNRSQSPYDLQKLVNQMNPLIQAEVNRRAGSLARETLESQAKKLAVRAFKNFDPSKGVKLSTHVTNQLQKLSRLNYAHKNAARIPEHSAMQYATVNIAKEDFHAEHGREPTNVELADTLRWSVKKVDQFEDAYSRPELLESLDTPADLFAPHHHDLRVEYALHEMSPRQQQIYRYSVGYGGDKKLSNTQIMNKLGITQGVLSYEKKKIRDILERSQ